MFSLVRLPALDDRLSEASFRFLAETGMPDGAELSFDDLVNGLRKIYDVYSPNDSNYPTAEAVNEALRRLMQSQEAA